MTNTTGQTDIEKGNMDTEDFIKPAKHIKAKKEARAVFSLSALLARLVTRAILTFCAICLAVFVLVQITLVTGISLINTGKSTAFIENSINRSLAQSGYRIALETIAYNPAQGIVFQGLEVADAQGAFLTLDRFSFKISLLLAPLRTIEFTGRGGTLILSRLPESSPDITPQEQAETSAIQPFKLPNIYFRKFILQQLSFRSIQIHSGADSGTVYHAAPSLQAIFDLDDTIRISARMTSGAKDTAISALQLPQTIDIKAMLAPQTLDFAVNTLTVTAQHYGLNGKASGNLALNGALALDISLHHNNLAPLSNEAIEKIQATLSVTGTIAAPAVTMNADITTLSLKERGLDDIALVITSNTAAGLLQSNIALTSRLHSKPAALSATVIYDTPIIHIQDISGTAPAINIKGALDYHTGTAAITGDITAQADDLSVYSELAAMTLAGSLRINAAFSKLDDAPQSAVISADLKNAAIQTIRARTLHVTADLPDITSSPWPDHAVLNTEMLRIAEADLLFRDLNASIQNTGQNTYAITTTGTGRAAAPFTFKGKALIQEITQTIPAISNIDFSGNYGDARIAMSGDITTDHLAVTLTADNLSGQDIPASIPPQMQEAAIDLKASLTGTMASPHTKLDAVLKNMGTEAYKDTIFMVGIDHDGQALSATLSGTGAGIRTLRGNARFAMPFSLQPFLFTWDPDALLTGMIEADIDLAAITPALLPPTQSAAGSLAATGNITGTVTTPVPDISLHLSDVIFEDSANGIVIQDISAAASLTKEHLLLSSLSATDGGDGIMNGNGSFYFNEARTSIDIKAKDFNAPRSNLANGTFSTALTLQGVKGNLDLTGTIDIAELEILIPEQFSSIIPELNIVEDDTEEKANPLEDLALDIKINANNQIFVRGWGLDAEFGGDLAIGGTAATPLINGTLAVRRGRFEEFGKRFALKRANLRFQGSVPPSPYLDIEATTPAGDVTGIVLMTGSVSAPKIGFASSPALPEDEVLSRILFGRDTAGISPFQAVQLAHTIQRFSGKGGGGINPLGMLRDATGLDNISVNTDDEGGASIDVGKYLTDNVYLEFSQGSAENSSAATIEIELTPSINIESRIGQDAQAGGGIFWKRDY